MTTQTEQTFPLDGPINLFVRIGRGAVTVETREDRTEAMVRLVHAGSAPHGDPTLADPPVAAVMDGPTLHVATPREGALFDLFGRGRTPALDVHIVVPTGTAVRITTHDAPITIIGRVAGADLAFGRGRADVQEVDGDLRLRFGQGTVRVARVGGSVHARSGAGDVQVGEIGGELRSGCGSGDVEVQILHGAGVVRSGSGGARLGEVHGDVDLTSGSGAMEIGLPDGRPARVDLHTGSGQVRCDLPVDSAPRASDGAITVRARTGHGDVRVFRAA